MPAQSSAITQYDIKEDTIDSILIITLKIIQNLYQMSNKKQTGEVSSIQALSHTTEHSEATKKAISTQEIEFQHLASQFQKQSLNYHINIPFQANIKSLVRHLKIKISENQNIILLFSNEKSGQILLQQLPDSSCWFKFLDLLCLCRKQGWPKKAISQTFQVISLTVKRQYVDYKCSISIKSNFSRNQSSERLRLFMEQIIQFIRKCLETFKDIKQYPEIKEIEEQSPLGFEINAMKKISGILVDGNSDKRLKTLFDTSLMRIRTQVEEHRTNKKQRVSEIMQKIVNETNSLFTSICNTPGISQMGLHQDYTLYAIENLYCYNFIAQLFDLYRNGMEKNCEQFAANCKHINNNLTSAQYFDYLEVRDKFRLPKSSSPYSLAINALRKMQSATNLRQLLFCVQKTFSLLKVCCLSQNNGKLDISSMDDILPVMIFIVAKAEIENFPVYVKVIDDYIRIRGVFELEERVITTLYVATEDISKKVPQAPKQN